MMASPVATLGSWFHFYGINACPGTNNPGFLSYIKKWGYQLSAVSGELAFYPHHLYGSKLLACSSKLFSTSVSQGDAFGTTQQELNRDLKPGTILTTAKKS